MGQQVQNQTRDAELALLRILPVVLQLFQVNDEAPDVSLMHFANREKDSTCAAWYFTGPAVAATGVLSAFPKSPTEGSSPATL